MKRLIAYSGIIAFVILGGSIGFIASFIIFGRLTEEYIIHLMIALGVLAVIRVCLYRKAEKQLEKYLNLVPENAFVFIKEIIRQMRYRKKVRSDVMSELVAHFEDELRDCKTDEQKNKKVSELIDGFGDPKLLGILLRRAKKRCRPLWRTIAARAFQAVIILIVLFAVYVVWFLSGKPVITTDYLAQLNRIVRPAADQSQNAAPFYIEAAEMIKDTPKDMYMWELLRKDLKEMTGEEKNKIEDWLSSQKEVFELVAQGSLKPYYWREYETNEEKELMSVLLPNLSGYRNIAQGLTLRASLNAEKGNLNQAYNDIITCYRFGRHLKADVSLVEQLVGVAIEVLSVKSTRSILDQCQPDSASLEKLQSDLQEVVSSDDFKVSFKTEKLFILDEAQRCFTDGIWGSHLYIQRVTALSDGGISSDYDAITKIHSDYDAIVQAVSHPVQAFRVLFTHPDKKQTLKTAEQMYDYYEQLSRKSPAALRNEKIDIENEIMEMIKGNLLLEIFTPAFWRVIEINHQVKTEICATITIIAAHRYKIDKTSFPDGLNELVSAGYLKDLPIDSFSDKPLVYRKTGDDFILYSVGRNFIDDGGVLDVDSGATYGIWGQYGDAVFWPVKK